MVKPSEKEIRVFRKYLEKQGFSVDGLCKDSYYLYMQYGYLCVSIESTKKGEFKDVRVFLSGGRTPCAPISFAAVITFPTITILGG